MLPTFSSLRAHLRAVVKDKGRQGHKVDGLINELELLPDSYDALHDFSNRVAALPLREDWPYIEPNDWAGIGAACDPNRPQGPLRSLGTGRGRSSLLPAQRGAQVIAGGFAVRLWQS